MDIMAIRRSILLANQGVETYLCKNYSPNGEKFAFVIDGINLSRGDYIEISADLTNCSHDNENIISVGNPNTINKWYGQQYHSYSKLSSFNDTRSIEISARYRSSPDSTSRFMDLPLQEINTVTYRIDKNGISYDGKLLSSEGATQYSQLISYLNSRSVIAVGSQEGTTRFYGTYNYIKWVKK